MLFFKIAYLLLNLLENKIKVLLCLKYIKGSIQSLKFQLISNLKNPEISYKKGLAIAIILSLIASLAIFLPFIIKDKGFFLFYGDYNVQQIPFYQLAHDCVKNGNILWNWNTELGANFIGSYSYYMLMSPFFWIMLPFPNWCVPYLMGPMYILKHTVAVIFAYMFICRFVKDRRYAILGSIMYSFSGFMISNIFFNQFHESVIFFPLLLIGLEKYLTENKKVLFCLFVFINCIVNYWMFIGEAVFLIVYFFCRITDAKIKITFKQTLGLLFEAIVGVLMASFILIPSLLAIAGNNRVGTDHLLRGWNLLLYSDPHRIPAIIQSFFFPPELPMRPTFFPYQTQKAQSMAAWLPFIGMTGVIAFLLTRVKTWIKTLLIVLFTMSLFPFLNSLFWLGSNCYYCRWFHALVLIMCVATVIAFENKKINLLRSIKWSAIITALFLLPGALGLVAYKFKFYTDALIALIGILILWLVIIKYRRSNHLSLVLIICTLITSIVYPFTFIYHGKYLSEKFSPLNNVEFITNHIINARDKINLPTDEFYRIQFHKDIDNVNMFWKIPAIQCFHSIVPRSAQDFYTELGVPRLYASRFSSNFYELPALLSSKYLFVRNDKLFDKEYMDSIPSLKEHSIQNGYRIYENEHFIPIGFCYDTCVGKKDIETLTSAEKRKLLLKSLYLEDDDIKKYGHIIPRDTQDYSNILFYETSILDDVENRKKQVVQNFKIDNRGFSGNIDLDYENLVFFSIPFDEGWTAKVNEKPTKIIKANIGLMAVKCDKGYNKIRFDYMTPGIKKGAMLSAIGLTFLFIYAAIVLYINRRANK